MQVRTQLEYVHCKDIPGSTPADVHVAIPAAISSATVMTWTNTIVGSSRICHTSTNNLPELHRQEAADTSLIDLSAISDAAAKETIQQLKQNTEDAWCVLSQETENHRIALLQQRVTFEEQLDIEKRKMDEELAASWAANKELKELVKRINTSERYMSKPRGKPQQRR